MSEIADFWAFALAMSRSLNLGACSFHRRVPGDSSFLGNKFYTAVPRGSVPAGPLNETVVSKIGDFCSFLRSISETVEDMTRVAINNC